MIRLILAVLLTASAVGSAAAQAPGTCESRAVSKAGKPLAELKATITPASVKSLAANGYGAYMAENLNRFSVYVGSRTAFEDRFTGNIEAIYNNLDRT